MGSFRISIRILGYHVALFRPHIFPLARTGWRHVIGDVWVKGR